MVESKENNQLTDKKMQKALTSNTIKTNIINSYVQILDEKSKNDENLLLNDALRPKENLPIEPSSPDPLTLRKN